MVMMEKGRKGIEFSGIFILGGLASSVELEIGIYGSKKVIKNISLQYE
jgi:hypothetical protein